MIETTKIYNLKLYGSVQNQLYAVHFEKICTCTLKVQKHKIKIYFIYSNQGLTIKHRYRKLNYKMT